MELLEAGQVGWWLSIDFRGCSLFGDDALGSDLLLLLMRLGLALIHLTVVHMVADGTFGILWLVPPEPSH